MASNTQAQGAVEVQSFIANFKEIYGDFQDLVPSELRMSDMIPFASAEKQGGAEYVEPVSLSLEGGFTYGGSEGLAFDLNKYVQHTLKDARVKSCELVLRSAISNAMVTRSTTDKNSFKRGIQLLIANMTKSMYHRLECALLYGQVGLGVVESATPVIGDVNRIVLKIEDAEWASGIWNGTNKHRIDLLAATLASQIAVPAGESYAIDSYSIEDRTVTIVGLNSNGAMVDISSATIAQGTRIFFQGEVAPDVSNPVHYNFAGLQAIAQTRGTLFTINNTKEPLFQGNVVNCGTSSVPAKLSFAVIERSAAQGVQKGVSEEKMTALVSVNQWSDLLVDQAAKRRYNGTEVAKLKEGGRDLEFFGQTGSIEVVPSTFVKEGYAFTFCAKDLIRIGACDVTMTPPGHEDDIIRKLENNNGYQIRGYSDQALFTSKPGGISVIRYVTSSHLEA